MFTRGFRRVSSTADYRYGFNGKENDNEVEGQQDYGLRIYDKRLGRFKSVDPLTTEYPWYTPYQFAGNRPIVAIDLDGGEPDDTNEKMKESDVPTEKHKRPSLLRAAFNQFSAQIHKTSSQAFASEREKQKDVVGVTTFDYDANNIIAITYSKANVIVVDADGNNSYETRINATYSVFRADGNDKVDLTEAEFFSKPKSELFGREFMEAPIPGSGGKAVGGLVQAGAKLSKFASLSIATKYGIKSYEALRKLTPGTGTQVHHLFEKRFANALKLDEFKNVGRHVVSYYNSQLKKVVSVDILDKVSIKNNGQVHSQYSKAQLMKLPVITPEGVYKLTPQPATGGMPAPTE